MPDWIKQKQRNWPTGSRARALKGKTALEALRDKLSENNRPEVVPLEGLDDEKLALTLSGAIIKCMHELGVGRATRKANREPDPGIPCPDEYPCLQSEEPGNLRSED